ncbi:hypothetical protein FQN60_006757 [Etheostoma spectabile]|uniref:VWFD domain-containing protein n=1 Tax=Etheostoma spectabile TaxID=54343 RepID=A0A5J5CCL1_9PERO|nr:hypothetical protein FQN60_006757 [Etheostoma spectabile]
MDSCAFGCLRIAMLWLLQSGALAQHAPECYPGGHRTLRNPYRSVDFDSTEIQNTAIQDLICDHSLPAGWYRFKINNKPAEMPTACVEMNRCGTQAPVWLSLKDRSLPLPGEVRQLSACATWQFFQGSTKDCCLFRIPITVRNCGEFLLYHLQPTQGCMGYCAKDVGPRLCRAGELIGHSVHLRCSFVPPPWNQPMGFQVVWARHIGHSMKAEIRQESTLKPFSVVEMDGVHFRLGETFSPDSLLIAENGKEHEVSVHSTVPVPCYGPVYSHQYRLRHEAPNVALSACQVELQTDACSGGSCGRTTFLLTAVTDFTRDGNRASLIGVLPGPSAPRLWRSYVPTSLRINCAVRRRYENHQTGTFVLYRSTVREFEVHSRQWDCGSRHYTVACNCGVAAREGNDIAVFDMCNGRPQETRPQLTLKNLGDEEGSRVRVLESHQGKKVTLIFPSGAFVRADVGDWGMSLSVRAPSGDYGNTRGLCGTFDHNGTNDFHGSDGGSYGPDGLHRFIEYWRTPPGTMQEVQRPFCACQKEYSASHHAGRAMRNLYNPSAHSDCTSHNNVDYTSVFPSMDTTVEYIKSPEREESILDTSAFNSQSLERKHWFHTETYPNSHGDLEPDSGFWEDLLISRPPRQALFDFQPVFAARSLSAADLENFAYFFPEDHSAEARPAEGPRWPTPSGLTSAKALEVCQIALANSTVGAVCRGLLGRRLDEAVDLCMLDLQLKDDLGWEEALLPYLENECEKRLLENRTWRASEVAGPPGTSKEVVMALRCPNFCNGNGECTEWGCQCQPVELTDLENGGLCDIRSFNCRNVRVFGLGFIDSPDLGCHASRLKYMNGVWVPGEKQRTKATFLSSKALDCAVPSLSNTAVNTEDFMMDEKPYARWEIKVTNDGSQYSQAKVLTIYDGLCQVCQASRSGLCKLKERTCNIEGMCFADGVSSPSSPCLLSCASIHTVDSRFVPLSPVNEPPAFFRPQSRLRTFAGENFVFQLAASDPEGSALLFQLEEGPQGAVLSPAGLLIWRVPSLPGDRGGTQSFRFTLSDECNAQSSFTAEGTQGDLCGEHVDGCLSAPCAAGRCINAAGGGYRCQCVTCLEDVNECERKPCFPGVQCFNNFGSYGCGPCPKGMLGNGTVCTAVTRSVPVPPTSASRTTVYKIPDVGQQPPIAKTDTFQKTSSGSSPQTKAEKTIPRIDLNRSQTKTTTWRRIPGMSLNPALPQAETNKSITAVTPILSQTNTDALIRSPGIKLHPSASDRDKISNTIAKTSTVAPPSGSGSASGSGQSPVGNVSATCASRPCFPGVQCINRRPPHVGYVCGRCPPGLYGNGRVCMKNAKAASNHLPQQQTVGKTGRSPQGSSGQVSQLHLPNLPTRHGIKHLSWSVTRANRENAPRQVASSGRGGGTERREAVTVASRDVPRTSVGALHSANLRSDATTYTRSSTTISGKVLVSTVTASKSGKVTQPKHLASTQTRPWTPARPAFPLTAALAALSYSLSESEFSADGDEDETGSEGPEVLAFTTPAKTVYDSPFQRAPSIQPGVRSGTVADKHGKTCADRPCFPGVPCEPAWDGGFRCGRCPVGYTGDGRACRGNAHHICRGV